MVTYVCDIQSHFERSLPHVQSTSNILYLDLPTKVSKRYHLRPGGIFTSFLTTEDVSVLRLPGFLRKLSVRSFMACFISFVIRAVFTLKVPSPPIPMQRRAPNIVIFPNRLSATTLNSLLDPSPYAAGACCSWYSITRLVELSLKCDASSFSTIFVFSPAPFSLGDRGYSIYT